MQPSLSVVPSSVPEPPYQKDTKANGYNVEFDVQVIESSSTWVLATSEERAWLLRVWYETWKSVPVGSMPSDLDVFAARIGCTRAYLEAHKSVLLRGWKLHSDDNLYHDFIVSRVVEMKRRRNAATQRMNKHRQKQQVKELKIACDASHSVTDASPRVTYAKDQDQDQDQEIKKKDIVASRAEKRPDPVPFEQIRETWIHMLPELTRPIAVEHWTAARKLLVTSRWRDQLPDIESWQTTFELIRKSKFLMGRTGPRPFKCTLFWIIKPENLLKLYEGVWADG